MIELKKLKELVDLMKEHDLSEIDLRDGDETVTLKRPLAGPAPAPAHHPVAQHAPPPAPAPAAPAQAGAAPAPDDGLEAIESPMVGTFYSASNPDSPPFVKVGDTVGPDTVVCLIEAMKVFSEVKAEKSGVIEKIAVKNSEAVEFGQPLFLIRPS
jgi:acetyl-CoA carboxylase biotin carboxyl carrier protein